MRDGMNCPYCGARMAPGELRSSGDSAVFWMPKSASIKLCIRKSIEGQSGVLLDEIFPVGFIAKRRPTSYYCQACRTLLARPEP